MNSCGVTIQMKPLQQDFYTVVFIIQHLTNRILNFVNFFFVHCVKELIIMIIIIVIMMMLMIVIKNRY